MEIIGASGAEGKMTLWQGIKVCYYWLRGYPVLFHDVKIEHLKPPCKKKEFEKMRSKIDNEILMVCGIGGKDENEI